MAISAEAATDYKEVKAAILKCYGINKEAYHQRFRAAKLKKDESYDELSIRLGELFDKWIVECKSIADVRENIAMEQLLSGMPRDLRIWVAKKKPATGDMAASS